MFERKKKLYTHREREESKWKKNWGAVCQGSINLKKNQS